MERPLFRKGIVTATLAAGALAVAAAAPQWPMFQYDRQRSGRSPSSGPQTPDTAWTLSPGGAWNYSCVVVGDDGTVYYCGLDDSLLAVNPDGVPRWRFGRKHESQTPCLDSNGRIYVMVADGLLCQLEDSVTHPRVRWRRD